MAGNFVPMSPMTDADQTPDQTIASTAHAPLLAAIHGEAFADPWDSAAFVALLNDPTNSALLFAQDGEPVGFILCRLVLDEAEIITIATRPCCQRQGWGRRMITSMAASLRARGAATLFLEVADDNSPAQALYEQGGFQTVGRRKGYYPPHHAGEQARDALVMSLAL